ncbi:MAG: 3-isopropylmalate dehydratase small subunit [Acidobacteria bacterium]|nr:3-isopropylmalate dehydratase small subunit [Acidobacteriota bacterium]
MQPFHVHTGVVAPLPRPDVDTDQIIPKQFLKRLGRTGFADALFYDWRVDAVSGQARDFVLNDPRYAGASVLIAGQNFGCGSSREHAVWALHDFGFRVVLAPSFADIFASNAVANGFLAARIDDQTVEALVSAAERHPGVAVTVDLEALRVTGPDGLDAPIVVDARARARLLEGLDDIALILRHEDAIARFEAAHGGAR